MATVIINGKGFLGRNVSIDKGKVVIDGRTQDGEVSGAVAVQVIESGSANAECTATVTCGQAGNRTADCATAACNNVAVTIHAGNSGTIRARGGSGIRAVAIASAGPQKCENNKR